MVLHEGFIAPTIVTLSGLFIVSPTLKADLRTFISDRGLLLMTVVFLVCFVSGLWSENTASWMDRSRIKMPLLALPVVLLTVRNLPRQWLLGVLAFFVMLTLLTAVGVVINYFASAESINLSISRGGHLPVPVHHIRFSLLVALAILISFYLFEQRFHLVWRGERHVYLIAPFLLGIFLHVLAVRSGLAGFYVAILFIVARAIIINRKWLLGLSLLVAVAVAPIITYYTVDSFRMRINYMRHDMEMFFSGQSHAGYSDSRRLISMQTGMEIGKEAPLLGVGMGDLADTLDKAYEAKHLSNYSGTLPHNQFIVFFAGTGIVGLLLSLVGMVAIMFTNGRSRSWLLVAMTLLLLTSCLFEATLETQLGVAIYAFMTTFLSAVLSRGTRTETA